MKCKKCGIEIGTLVGPESLTCPICGENLAAPPKDNKQGPSPASPQRSISAGLGLGIFLLPYIFSWWTLRKGYSVSSRVVSFLWCVALLFSMFSGGVGEKKNSGSPPSPTQAPRQVEPQHVRQKDDTKQQISLSKKDKAPALTVTPPAKVACLQFDVFCEANSRELVFHLSSDLPNDTIVMVSVSRDYWEDGKGERHSGSYYEEKKTVSDLKQPVRVALDDVAWSGNLNKLQKMMSVAGQPFQVVKISDEVSLSIIVPVNQTNPAFGQGNVRLEGPFVSKDAFRTIKHEKSYHIPYPHAAAAQIIGKKQHSLSPCDLELNLPYSYSARVPISRELSPKDPLAAIAEMRYLPPNSVFRILQKQPSGNSAHYYVQADLPGSAGARVTGWIYCPALMGEDLRVAL